MRLLGGEERLCSLLANTACKHKRSLARSLLLSFFAVHQFCLPAVQLGGQPRHWGVELGFCPMRMQKIPQNTLLSYGLQSLTAYIAPHVLTSGCVALPQAYQWHRLCARPVVCHSCWAYLLLLFGPVLVLWPDPIDCVFICACSFSLTKKWSYI